MHNRRSARRRLAVPRQVFLTDLASQRSRRERVTQRRDLTERSGLGYVRSSREHHTPASPAARPPRRPARHACCAPPAPLALLDVAQAEKFLCDLEEQSAAISSGDPARIAYLLGQAERHLARMSDILRAVTGLPR